MSAESEMIHRAAAACRNLQAQVGADGEWFGWVPTFLDRLAQVVPEGTLEHASEVQMAELDVPLPRSNVRRRTR